jgi:hypothetical protein
LDSRFPAEMTERKAKGLDDCRGLCGFHSSLATHH